MNWEVYDSDDWKEKIEELETQGFKRTTDFDPSVYGDVVARAPDDYILECLRKLYPDKQIEAIQVPLSGAKRDELTLDFTIAVLVKDLNAKICKS